MGKKIIIGTRGSKLALWQANFVKDALVEVGEQVQIQVLKTQGDRVQDLPLEKLEGKGFFTSELEAALHEQKIDLAVHSMKDLPTESPSGLTIAGVSERADPADWLLIPKIKADPDSLLHLPANARVGTSSNRRKAQLRHFRSDVQLVDIRGNVPTRLQKVLDGKVDAAILAAAGLTRLHLDLNPFDIVKFHPREFIPAPAQGVLAYQVRKSDERLVTLIRKHLHHPDVSACTNVERTLLRMLEGGCHLPLGAYCERDKMGYYHLWSAFARNPMGDLRLEKLSYSTTDGLAEAVAKKYLNN